MICPRCKKEDQRNMEMCPDCGAPIKPIPVPPGGKIRFGAYDWYVLDKQDDRMLIITEKVIERRPYHHEECELTWETSDMRKYLNGKFYESFKDADRDRIIETINENPDNPWYGASGGNPTADKIFLLSIDEVVKYFGDSGQINTREEHLNCDWCKDKYWPWFGDQYNLNRRAVDNDGIVRHWTLRSPGANGHNVTFVMGFCGDEFDHGGINMVGSDKLIDGHFVFDKCNFMATDTTDGQHINGVRPALWLKNEE
jgi:hypothetical protein